MPLSTSPSQDSIEVKPEEACFVTEQKLPVHISACAKSVMPSANMSRENPDKQSVAALLNITDLPAVVASFRHLSNKVKLLKIKDLTNTNSDATIMTIALKETRLPSQALVKALGQGQGYCCDLSIVSVFVARGEAANSSSARTEAYAHATVLLQKPYLRLAKGHDNSTMLVASNKPFLELISTLETRQSAEIDVTLATVPDSNTHQRAEYCKGHSSSQAEHTHNSVMLDIAGYGNCAVANSSGAEDATSVEEKQDIDNCEITGLSSEVSHAMSSLPNHPVVNISSNNPDAEAQSTADYLDEQNLMQKTIVTAKSKEFDLSRLVNRFHLLSHTAKDIFVTFQRTKSVKDMVEMALHMSQMCSKTEFTGRGFGPVCAQLLVDNVLVAAAEDCGRKSAKLMAYGIAADLLCMPYLCLEEEREHVRLLGSKEPFTDSSFDGGALEPDGVKWNSTSKQENGSTTDKKDLSKPLTAVPYDADLSELVTRFHSLACKVKALSNSVVKFNNSIELVGKALGGSKMRCRPVIFRTSSNVNQCDLTIDGVEISCGRGCTKKEAKHVAFSAAVDLLMKPYLRLEEDLENNHSYKLIGSDEVFVGVSSGILPSDSEHISVVPGKKQYVQLDVLAPCKSVARQRAENCDSLDNAFAACKLPSAELDKCDKYAVINSSTAEGVTPMEEKPDVDHCEITGISSEVRDTKSIDIDEGESMEHDVLQPAIIGSFASQRVETFESRINAQAACIPNYVPVASVIDDNNTSTVEVSTLLEEKQDIDHYETVSTTNEISYTKSLTTLLNQSHSSITDNKPDVQAQTMAASDKQELVEYRKTVVIAKSDKDLSRLVNRFHTLAHMTKDISAMFKSTKSVKNILEIALHMSQMCMKTEVIKLEDGHVCIQLLVNDVSVAVAEDYDRKSAKMMAYNIAIRLLCMPYLCLEETHEGIQLFGSKEPFSSMSYDAADDAQERSYSSRGFWLNNSHTTANADDKKDVCTPLTASQCCADLSRLILHFHSLACKVKPAKMLKVNSGVKVMENACKDADLHMEVDCVKKTVGEVDVRYQCQLSIDGVKTSSGEARKKKRAKRAAYDAAVELLKKPYLRLQEDPELTNSFMLIGSDQPFVGVLSGVLPFEQNSVVDGEQAKQPAGQGDNVVDSDKQQPLDRAQDFAEVKCKSSFKGLSKLSEASNETPANKRGLCETQISSLIDRTDVSELVNQFYAIVQRVNYISRSLTGIPSSTDIVEMALADMQMQNKMLIIWLNSVAFRCQLCVDSVVIAHGEGDTKEQAKQVAYEAAVELLRKPYLLLQENSEFKRSYRLVGSDEPFTSVSCRVHPYKQDCFITDKRRDQVKQPSSENSTTSINGNPHQHVATVPAHSLSDFVILRNHFKNESKHIVDILQQSANFNNWPLKFNLVRGEGECRCCLTLGGHTLANAVGQGKNSAKKAAAEQALKQLSSTCYSVKVKKFNVAKFDVPTNALTRNEV